MCVKRVLPMMRLFSSQRIMTLYPLLVRSHTPPFPITPALFLMLHPTLAIRPPSKSKMSSR